MKKALIAALALLPLAACADEYGYAGPGGPGPIAYDGFYDDYYGPIYDGYWGGGGAFYYRTSEHGHWRHDHGGHFRHDMGPGPGTGGHSFHPMHGNFTPPAGGFHGGHGGGHHH
jgi:hypothetical protein